MKPAAHRRPATQRSSADRDRAVARLRRLTIGSTIASIAAAGAFGGLAALTDRGTIVDGVTTAAITIDAGTTDAASDDDTGTSDTSASDTTTTDTSAATTTPTTTATSPTVTSTGGAAQATTGGS